MSFTDLRARNRQLMERAIRIADACYNPVERLVVRPNMPEEYPQRWGFDVVQSTVWYSVALAAAGSDEAYRVRLNETLQRQCELQDRDPSSATYGNLYWYTHWTSVQDRNAVSFWAPEAGHVYLHHRDRLDDQTIAALAETFVLCVEGLDRHRVPWAYTNIFLLNILSRLALAKALERSDVLDQAVADWRTWYDETNRGGLTEYNSPTYIVTALMPLARMLPLAPDDGLRRQIEIALTTLFRDFCWHYHAPTQQLAGAMSRAYPGDWLRDSLTNLVAYQQWGEELLSDTMAAPFVAASDYQAPADILDCATRDKAGVTVRACIPAKGIRRLTSFGRRSVLGVKSGLSYGPQELALTVAVPAQRQPLLFLKSVYGTAIPIYSDLASTRALCGLVFRDAAGRDDHPNRRARLWLGPREAAVVEIDGEPWDGLFHNLDGQVLRLRYDGVTVDFRLATFALAGGESHGAGMAVLQDHHQMHQMVVELLAVEPVLIAVAVAVHEPDGQPPEAIAFDGTTLTSGSLKVSIPAEDASPVAPDEPLLEAPGCLVRQGEWPS